MSSSLLYKTENQGLKLETRDISENKTAVTQDQQISSSGQSEPATTTSSIFESSTRLATSPTTSSGNDTFTNSTHVYSTTPAHAHTGNGDAATAVGIIIILVVVALLLVLLLCYLKRKGKLSKLPCFQPMTRSRRSSSSSRHVLEEHEVMENDTRPKPEGQSDDTFTIDEMENTNDPQEGREEYYYDEVFGQSQFEDEATNSAMRELYSDRQDMSEEEILDLDFETLGIRITDYGPDIDRKNTV